MSTIWTDVFEVFVDAFDPILWFQFLSQALHASLRL